MAPQVVTDFVALVCAHPILAGMTLILFTPPFFPIVKFFSPLLISTALFMLLLFTMGPKGDKHAAQGEEGEEWEGSSAVEGRGSGDGARGVAKLRRPDGGWMDWVKSIEESSLAFMSPRARLKTPENWKSVNDGNVSILEDASWAKGADFSSYAQGEDSGVTEEESSASRSMADNVGNSFMPTQIGPSMLFKVDSTLKAAADRSVYDDMDLGEGEAPALDGDDAPDLEDVEEPDHPATPTPAPTFHQSTSDGVQHQPMQSLQIPKRVASDNSEVDSPYTDLDSPSDVDRSKRFMDAYIRRNSANARSGLSEPGSSDADTPVPDKLSLSGKLHQMEDLGDYIDDAGHAEQTGQRAPELDVLQPTTNEQVEAVKDQLESFVQEEKPTDADHSAPAPPSAPKPEAVAEQPKVSTVEETAAAAPTKAAKPKGEISEVH